MFDDEARKVPHDIAQNNYSSFKKLFDHLIKLFDIDTVS